MIAGALACLGLIAFFHIRQLWLTVAVLLLLAGVYLHTTRRGKFMVWRSLLDGLAWRREGPRPGLRTGHGAADGRRPRAPGRAVGIDIRSGKDQSGNAMAVTLDSAAREGVAERVGLHTADMRQLPFGDGSFDVVISNVAIHNIPAALGASGPSMRHGACCARAGSCPSRTSPAAANTCSGRLGSASGAPGAISAGVRGGVGHGCPRY